MKVSVRLVGWSFGQFVGWLVNGLIGFLFGGSVTWWNGELGR